MKNENNLNRRNFLLSTMAASTALATGTSLLNPASAAGSLKIGLMIPLSGPAGLFGPSSKNCAELAAETINNRGGIMGRPVELVFADAGVPPAEATKTAIRLMLSERVDAIIGMHDSAVRAAVIGALKAKIPYVYTPVYEGGECAKNTYVVGETPPQQLAPVIPWLAQNKGVNKWYMIGNDYNWPRLSNEAAKSYIASVGGKVVGEQYLPFDVNNFDANIAQIKDSGANGVLITLVGGASVGFNRSFAGFGLADSVYRLGTLIEENTLLGIGAENSKNLFSSAGYFGNINTLENQNFVQRFQQKFGAKAPVLNTLGQSCYQGVLLLEAMAKRAGQWDKAKLAATAEGTTFDSPRGTVTLRNRHVDTNVYLAEANGVSFEVVKTFPNIGSGATCS